MLTVILLCACSPSMDYSSQNLSAGWSHDEVVRISLSEEDRSASEVNIVVDHDISYGYQNLYLVMTTSGETSSTDTISLQLADNRGSWLSPCRSDHCLFTYPVEVDNSVTDISIAQYSREDVLKGINQIGIKL